MHARLLEKISAEIEKRKSRKDFGKLLGDLSLECFNQQLDFINDPRRRVVAMCSRRAGKSTGVGYLLLKEVLSGENRDCIYITKTIERGRNILWRPLNDLIAAKGIRAEANNTTSTIYFPDTGGKIYFMGINNAMAVDRPLGMFFTLAVIDEAQSFPPYLVDLCKRVLSACLSDLQGKLVLIGTPNPSCSGFFHEAYAGDYYSKHTWTWEDNKFFIKKAMASNSDLKTRRDILGEILKEFGLEENDPHAQREWFGRCVRSSNLQVYCYSEKNFGECPERDDTWDYVMGADFGLKDAFTMCVWGFRPHDRKAYLVDEFKRSGVDAFAAAELLAEWEKRYSPIASVVDGGGLGKWVAEGINRIYLTNLTYADKTRKAENIALYCSDLRRGNIVVRRDSYCVKEAEVLFWDEKFYNMGIFRETDGQENDANDAAIYSWRFLQHHLAVPAEPKILRDSNDWAEKGLENLRNRGEDEDFWGDREEFLQRDIPTWDVSVR